MSFRSTSSCSTRVTRMPQRIIWWSGSLDGRSSTSRITGASPWCIMERRATGARSSSISHSVRLMILSKLSTRRSKKYESAGAYKGIGVSRVGFGEDFRTRYLRFLLLIFFRFWGLATCKDTHIVILFFSRLAIASTSWLSGVVFLNEKPLYKGSTPDALVKLGTFLSKCEMESHELHARNIYVNIQYKCLTILDKYSVPSLHAKLSPICLRSVPAKRIMCIMRICNQLPTFICYSC